MSPARITAGHETWQEPGTEEQWSDSFYFGGGDGRGLAFYARIGRRPNEEITEGALGIWLPGQGFLLSFARSRRQEPGVSAVAAGPLSFDCLRSRWSLWEIRFDGDGPPVRARGAHRHRPRRIPAGRRSSATLRFTAWGDPLSFESGPR